jgi:hypothetical protein
MHGRGSARPKGIHRGPHRAGATSGYGCGSPRAIRILARHRFETVALACDALAGSLAISSEPRQRVASTFRQLLGCLGLRSCQPLKKKVPVTRAFASGR